MQSKAVQALLREPRNYTDRDLQSAHAPAAWVIYKPSRYRFNTGLFIIIKRLKAFTLAPSRSTAADGVVQPVKAAALSPPSDPSRGTAAWAQQPRLPSKPDCWVCLNQHPWYKEITRKTLQKQFSYPMTLKPTLGIQTIFKYVYVFFHHCSSIFRFYC